MRKEDVLAELRKIGLVPVLRASSVDKALALASAIADGGVTPVRRLTPSVRRQTAALRSLISLLRIGSLSE